jgi:GH25 family lysozyme M1 (1,4-beta-N-acetylmuramidase)
MELIMKKLIDISQHNGIVNFNKVKTSGIDGVIIRAGFGRCNKDPNFDSYINGAIKAGIKYIGIYYFSYAYTLQMARREAQFCNDIISPYRKYINLPVFFDWEYDSMRFAKKNGYTLGRATITELNVVFCDRISELGYKAGYYLNLDYQRNFIDVSKLTEYQKWFAYYKSDLDNNSCDFWQYSSSGAVNGVRGNVDMNYYFDSAQSLKPSTPSAPATKPKPQTITDEEYNMKLIKRGSTGKAVKVWQIIIGTTVDGIFGTITEQKTIEFQKKYGLVKDGVVGAKTWKKGLESV